MLADLVGRSVRVVGVAASRALWQWREAQWKSARHGVRCRCGRWPAPKQCTLPPLPMRHRAL